MFVEGRRVQGEGRAAEDGQGVPRRQPRTGPGVGFMGQGIWLRVQSLGCVVWVVGHKVQGVVFEVCGAGCAL